MRIIYDSQLSDITPTASTENPSFPGTNALTNSLDQAWRTTDINDETLVFDAGAGNTFTCNSVSIIDHNLTNAATIKFQMHTSDSWGTPDVDETLTWRSGTIINYFTSASKRYIRFYIDDPTNTNAYLSIGRVLADTYVQVDPTSEFAFNVDNIRTDEQQFTQTNTLYSNQGVGYRGFEYSFPKTNFTMLNKIRTLYNTVGNHTSFIFTNYDSDYTEIAPAYVTLIGSIREQWFPHQKSKYRLTLRESR